MAQSPNNFDCLSLFQFFPLPSERTKDALFTQRCFLISLVFLLRKQNFTIALANAPKVAEGGEKSKRQFKSQRKRERKLQFSTRIIAMIRSPTVRTEYAILVFENQII